MTPPLHRSTAALLTALLLVPSAALHAADSPNNVYPSQASVDKMRPEDARPWELYDLSRDPAELNDLATEFPERSKATQRSLLRLA